METSNYPPPIAPPPGPPVQPATVPHGSTLAQKIFISLYAVLAAVISFGNNVSGPVGDFVRYLTLPMFGVGAGLGIIIFIYGINISAKKDRPMVVRILSPIVGLAVGFVVFIGAAWLALIASLSNVHESGD
jgi:hypothetical protein